MNRGTTHPIFSLCYSIISMRWCPVMHFISPKFMRVKICLQPCVMYSDPLFITSPKVGPGTISL